MFVITASIILGATMGLGLRLAAFLVAMFGAALAAFLMQALVGSGIAACMMAGALTLIGLQTGYALGLVARAYWPAPRQTRGQTAISGN